LKKRKKKEKKSWAGRVWEWKLRQTPLSLLEKGARAYL